jgi:enoyl-CoA hydratase
MVSSTDILQLSRINKSILHILLNRPNSLNALSAELMAALYDILTQAKADASVRAVLITGAGKAFCAGADINQLAKLDANSGLAFAQRGQMIFRLLEQLGKPSLAAIQGFALGGGCELAMAATIRIASDAACFGQPEVKLGVIPGFGGTQRLSRLVGKGRALDLCLTGRIIKADEALRWGLITEVVATENLLGRATEILSGLTQLAPRALQAVMQVIDEGYDIPLTAALELEAAKFAECCATHDKQEGVAAFLEKRSATFSGE